MMLELQNHFTIEIENVKDLATTIFVIVDDIYKEVAPPAVKHRKQKETAIMSDSEIITISILGELLGHDSENAWVSYVSKNMRDLFPNMCERSRFNRTRRNLMTVIKAIRQRLFVSMKPQARDILIIDSFPLPVCQFGRAHFSKGFKFSGASYGYCPSKKMTYYGYKVHALCTMDGAIVDFVVTSANTDDREAVWELVKGNRHHLFLIGDKGYISPQLAEELLTEKGVSLIYIKRRNAKKQYPKAFRQLVFKIRRRIETSFSQLTEQLNIERVKAKSRLGLIARFETKILAFNSCLFVNQLLGKVEDVARIKALVF
jgi:hypothetical protein